MSDINFSKLTWENLPARTTALSAQNLNRIEKGIDDSVNGVNANSHSIAELQTRISQVASGTPEPVNTIAEMTDHSKIYVYTGSEQDESTGYWYRYDSTQNKFVPGGQYGGAVTDTTLSVSGAPADAKAVGDALALKADADDVGDMSQLTTTAKDNLVSAINETDEAIAGINGRLERSNAEVQTLGTDLLSGVNWEIGGINLDGTDLETTARIRTEYIAIGDYNSVTLSVDSGWKYLAVLTDSNKIAVGTVSWTTGIKTLKLEDYAGVYYIRITIQRTDNTVDISDYSHIHGTYSSDFTDLAKCANLLNVQNVEWKDGYGIVATTGNIVANQYRSYCELSVAIFSGGKLKGETNDADSWGLAFYDTNGTYISGLKNPVAGTYTFVIDTEIPENAVTVKISCRTDYKSAFFVEYPFDVYTQNVQNLKKNVIAQNELFEAYEKATEDAIVPVLRNGSAGNIANANAVTSEYILPINKKYDYAVLQFIGNIKDSYEYGFSYVLFHGASNELTTTDAFNNSAITKKSINSNFETAPLYSVPYIIIPISDFYGYEHISVTVFRKENGVYVPIRIDTEQYSIRVLYGYNFSEISRRDIERLSVYNKTNNARHIKGGNSTPLTLLHFSDLHGDKEALQRIYDDSATFTLDDIICTGDMVLNNAEQIASWWKPDILTCIGNHDSASYTSGTGYDWTALSMADRSAYYIEPFESGWGITHEGGKSYYYKDYSDANVRMIVMDAMLYSSNPGTDATAQTTWLENLLANAITNNLHVLIAIHAPHGGATAKDCSFSRYGQTTMPTYSDCNTPQTVVDTVATKISNGLKFIGYIVGHTHQDNIWDAESDGKQLMYCVTCAATKNNAQWINSDQYRGPDADAYNIVTIDTANTLVKIVRGGGADMDDHMRTRKAICFNYSTGTMVGEVH